MSEREFERFLALVYEAPLNGELWPEALERLSGVVGAMGAALIPMTETSPFSPYATDTLRVAFEVYQRDWQAQDFVAERARRRKINGVFTDADLSTTEERARAPIYQEFQRGFGIGRALVYNDATGAGACAALQLPLDKPDLSADGRALYDRHIVHIGRAMRMAARLGAPLTPTVELEDALAVIAAPAAILGADKRVVFANPPFEALQHRGLTIVDSRLIAAACAQQAALDRLIGQAVAAVSPAGGALALTRAQGRPLVVQATPISAGARALVASAPAQRRALVVVTDPEDSLARSEAALIALGLTPMEAKLAGRIGSGLSPAQAALELGNSEATARTLLKRVFAKLDIERQSQLANLVARLGAMA